MKKFMKALAFGALVFAIGCTKKSKVDYNLDISETLRWHVATEPPSLDYIVATDTTSARVTDALMVGLISYGFKSDEVVNEPALAVSWEGSKDMKTWTFTLRQGVKWTDGVEFTAQHVLDGWERLLNSKTGAEYANFLFNVKNAKNYFDGKVKDFGKVGVKIIDGNKIEVKLETPQSYFPSLLAHHSTFPVRKDIIAKHGDKWTEPNNFVGLVPYKLKIWDHDKAIVLERHDGYYGEPAKIKYILGRIVQEQSTALNMFKKGEVDALDEVPSVEIEKIKTMPEYYRVPILAVYYYGLNVTKPPLDNKKVRQALNYAVDRAEVNKVLGGEKIPANNVLPPGLTGHDSKIGLQFDPAKANKFLDEAGYKDRSKFPRLHLGFNTNENHQRIAENVQAQLKRNLGIEMEISNEEWKTYLKSLQAGAYQMYRLGWVADFPDPDTFINLFITNGGNNHTKWSNKRYDALIAKGVREADREKRKQIYLEAQKILNEDEVPLIPISYYRDQYLVNKRVKNYPQNVMHKFYVHKAELVN